MSVMIRVQFLSGYSGKEWPPSPARLFKALVGTACAGWACNQRAKLFAALRELETLSESKPPEIVSSDARLHVAPRRRFVPNNSMSWPTDRKLNPRKGIDLEPEPIRSWDMASNAAVYYRWSDAPRRLAELLRPIARRITSVGKGEDFAIVDIADDCESRPQTKWISASKRHDSMSLEVPEAGCLDICLANFARSPSSPPLPSLGVHATYYARATKAETEAPLAIVLRLVKNGRSRSWDGRMLRQVVGPVRRLLAESCAEIASSLAVSTSDEHDMLRLVNRVLLGHDDNGDPVREPHLAVLPIPSIVGPHPDGRIRRVALVGFNCIETQRRAIAELASILIQGRDLADNGKPTGVTLEREPSPQWHRAIAGNSRSWMTVTPYIQTTKELTSSQWKRLSAARKSPDDYGDILAQLEQKLRDRRIELVLRSFEQSLTLDAQSIESIEFIPASTTLGVHLASHYRVAGYLARTPRFHLRITVDRPVSGPIAIGRGRHVGFGLMWPDESES